MSARRPSIDARIAAREAKEKATGKKPGGKPPAPPVEGPRPTDQINLTDEEWRIMPVAGGGFEQCYNAQAVVAAGSLLVVAVDVVRRPTTSSSLNRCWASSPALPEELGKAETLLADTGYFSEANVEACAAAGIDPLIAMGREPHHPSLGERFAGAPPAPENPTPVEAMAHRLQTPEGQEALRPAQADARARVRHHQIRTRIPPVLAARLENVRGEWSLVTMAWNIKRMFVLADA